MKLCIFMLGLLALSALPTPVHAEQFRDYDSGWRVHYNSMTTNALAPQIARAYSIQRSNKRGMIVIHLQNASHQPWPGTVTGKAKNLIGQVIPLQFTRRQEAQSLYYTAELGIQHLDTWSFNLQIMPEGTDNILPLRFHQQFFVDP